jgi:rhamnogalacturonyl hydrolase YesR
MRRTWVVPIFLLAAGTLLAQPPEFTDWPAWASPAEVGKRVAERFLASQLQGPSRQAYPEACAWYGALTFAQPSGDKDLTTRLIRRFDPILQLGPAGLAAQERHVDASVFAVIPLAIFIETRQPEYLAMGKPIADRQWENPTPDGLSPETRFWIDDMYMITILQVEAARATGDPKYLNRAATEMTAYLEKLQQPSGLFFHAPDAPFFWGRDDGWVAAGMAELLRSLPADHPRRARILEGYRKMMRALAEFQGQDGMWRQLIDHPEAWPETSSTGMFAFAMITGVKNGWIEGSPYAPAARKAWPALTGYIDQNADVTSVCEGTGKKNDLEYYLSRRRKTGDLHGQASVLWCAAALLR